MTPVSATPEVLQLSDGVTRTKVVFLCSGILKHWHVTNTFTLPFARLSLLLLCCFCLVFVAELLNA